MINWVEELIHPGEGDEDLSEERDNDPSVGGDRGQSKAKRVRKSRESTKASDVGRALRSVYDTTLREDVPRDFLDLLGKLS
jgi:hypothetical protein